MYQIHNWKTADQTALKEHLITDARDAKDAPSFYQLKSPFQLYYLTLHPEDSENYYLTTIFSPDFSVYFSQQKEEIQPYLSTSLHHHDYYELLLVLEGSLYQNIENKRHLYTGGSCCLLNKKVQHTEEYSTDFRAIFLQLSDSFMQELYRALYLNFFNIEREHSSSLLRDFLSSNLQENGNSTKNYIDFIPVENSQAASTVHHILELLVKELLDPQVGSSCNIMGLFCRLFHFLDSTENYRTTPVQIGTDAENRLYDLITEHMARTNGRITRQELSDTLHYSGVHLNNVVKKYTGLSLYDYGMTFCMKKAADLLTHSHLSISEIAASLNFSNRTQFYKVFNQTYHMSPHEYRKTHAQRASG